MRKLLFGIMILIQFSININLIFAQCNLVISDTTLPDTCAKSVGIAIVIAFGTPPYTYSWNTNPIQINDTATGLSIGLYTVTVTDSNGCVDSMDVYVANIPGPTIDTFLILQKIFCNGDSTGIVIVEVKEGSPPYIYVWSPGGGNDSIADSLSAAVWYSVTVTDLNQCTVADSILLTESQTLGISSNIMNASCDMVCNGAITIIPSGGSPPYTYMLNNDTLLNDPDFYSLCSGSYDISVSDKYGCFITDSVNLIAGIPFILIMNSTPDTSLSGVGIAWAVIGIGANPPYSYQWDSAAGLQTNDTAFGLVSGTYSVTVYDAIGCSVTDTIVIDNITNLSYNLTNEIIKIYPNPVKDNLYIEISLNKDQEKEFTMFNINGIEIFKMSTQKNLVNINLSDQKPGFYYITITTPGYNISEKILKINQD